MAAEEMGLRMAEVVSLYGAITCGVVVQDAAGLITYANAEAERVLGKRLEEMLHVAPASFLRPCYEDGTEISLENDPSLLALRTGRPARRLTIGVTREDGQRRWLQVDCVPVLDEGGRARQVVSTFVDITERIEAQATARVMAERLERLIEASSDAIIVTDLRRRVIAWNAGAEQMFGWSREEVIGRALAVIPSELERIDTGHWQQVLKTGQSLRDYETEALTKDGRRLPILVTLSPILDESGKVSGVVGISKDISALKRLEKQSRHLTRLEERERVALDLNIGAIQALYALSLRLGARARSLRENVEQAREILLQAEAEVLHVIGKLRRSISRPAASAMEEMLSVLTEQERTILPLIADGRTNRQIAATLGVSENTVKVHVSNILHKLHLTRRTQVAALVATPASI